MEWWRTRGARELQTILNEWDPIGVASAEHRERAGL
jgi:hypothetical protein